jgi:hypothetical protein
MYVCISNFLNLARIEEIYILHMNVLVVSDLQRVHLHVHLHTLNAKLKKKRFCYMWIGCEHYCEGRIK